MWSLVLGAAEAPDAPGGRDAADRHGGGRHRPCDRKGHGPGTGIKWPNDLQLHGRKCAGILLELGAESDQIHHVILGMGIDVNLSAEEIPPHLRSIATSLSLECGSRVDRPALAARVLEELDLAYHDILGGRFGAIADEWERRCTTLGRRVSIRVGSREIHGMAEALDEQGALLLRTEHGRLERIIGGEVSLLSAGPSS